MSITSIQRKVQGPTDLFCLDSSQVNAVEVIPETCKLEYGSSVSEDPTHQLPQSSHPILRASSLEPSHTQVEVSTAALFFVDLVFNFLVLSDLVALEGL